MISPYIDGIPNELLARIVTLCSTVASPVAIPDSSSLGSFTTSLRLVCTRWNTVIVSTPLFWTRLNISLPLPPTMDNPAKCRLPPSLLQTWLHRSVYSPLQIHIVFPFMWSDEVADVLDVLWTSVHRWKTVRLLLSHVTSENMSSRYSLCHAELLEDLQICMPGMDRVSTDDMPRLIEHFGCPPNLRSLDIGVRASIASAARSWLPLSQLTKLKISCASLHWREMFDLSRACVSLTWLSVKYQLPMNTALRLTFPLPPLEFPHLRILVIDTIFLDLEPFHTTLLRSLRCPQLELISISVSLSDVFRRVIEKLDPVKFASQLIINSNSSPHVLRLHASNGVVDLGELATCNVIGQIPIVEARFWVDGAKEEEKKLHDSLDRSPRGVNGSLHKVIEGDLWTVGWAETYTFPSSVKEYFSDNAVKPLHRGLFHLTQLRCN